nr:hypothetical protein [Klebsiella pneumoniae]
MLVLADGQVMTESAAIAPTSRKHIPAQGSPRPGDPARALPAAARLIVANIYPTFTYGDYPERWAPRDAEALVAHTDAYRIRLWNGWRRSPALGAGDHAQRARSVRRGDGALAPAPRGANGQRGASERSGRLLGDIDEVVRLMHDAAAWMSAQGTPARDVAGSTDIRGDLRPEIRAPSRELQRRHRRLLHLVGRGS